MHSQKFKANWSSVCADITNSFSDGYSVFKRLKGGKEERLNGEKSKSEGESEREREIARERGKRREKG